MTSDVSNRQHDTNINTAAQIKEQLNIDFPYVAKLTKQVSPVIEQLQNAPEEKKESPLSVAKNVMLVQVVGQPERHKRKNVVVNTQHCRGELDTVQYVVKKYGYRESRDQGDGNLYWYGLALRDNDIDFIKSKVCMINRYPLMDVSLN